VTRHVAQPTRPGGVLALLAAVGVVAAATAGGAEAGGQADAASLGLGLAAELVGVALLVGAAAAHRRGRAVVAGLLLLAGVGGLVGGVVAVVTGPGTLPTRLVAGTGVAGVGVLGAGVAPVRSDRARGLVTAGAAVLTVAVVLGGVLTDVGALPLLGAMVAAVVAWDAGERAVSLGEQVGVRARTWPVEVTRTTATALYGGAVVGATLLVRGLNVTDVPLVGLLLLLCGTVAVLVALSNH
jgi:hypothetical protein